MPRIRIGDLDDFDADDFDDLDAFDVDVDHHRRPPPRRHRAWDRTADDPELADDERRSTYQDSRAAQGPQPPPGWLVTTPAAIDRDVGVLKTGKEADVHVIERHDPLGGAGCLLAAKRYRSTDHRLFHRDSGYLERRRVRRSRETRAMATKTSFGRELLAAQWAIAEFGALTELWNAGVAVPYPVQCNGTELLVEFIGDADGAGAPRLAELRPTAHELVDLFAQCRAAMHTMASLGWTHGDLSPYNLLVHRGRLVVIDLPQVVDIVSNSHGRELLERDCRNIGDWFRSRGLSVDVGELTAELAALAGVEP